MPQPLCCGIAEAKNPQSLLIYPILLRMAELQSLILEWQMESYESQLGSQRVPVFRVVVINTIPRRNQEHLVIGKTEIVLILSS